MNRNNSKLGNKEYSHEQDLIDEAIKCGVKDSTARKIYNKAKQKNKPKSQNQRPHGSRKPKSKNHKTETIRNVYTYLDELDEEEKLMENTETIDQILDKKPKLSFDELKNM